jgi:hypothetical protein
MALLEEIHGGGFTWATVDTSTEKGKGRLDELRRGSGQPVPIPAIVADGRVVFDHLPDLEDVDDWLTRRLGPRTA